MGKIYGLPSFLTGRVVEQTTGSPVENALTVVIGPSFPSLIKTTIGGWFNIAENVQATGTYLIMAFKLGYHIDVEFVKYEGKPLQPMLEMTRWW